MVLRNEVRNFLGQADFFRQLDSIGHVAGDDSRTLRRPHVVVRVFALLVLDEVLRRSHLADVVIERADSRQQRICIYRATSIFG